MFLRDLCDFVEGEDVAERVADGFAVDDFCIRLNCAAEVFWVSGVNEGNGDAEFWKRVFELCDRTAIKCGCGNDMIARFTNGQDGGRLRGVTRADFQCTDAAFEARDSFFKNIAGWVGDAGVDVATFLQCKETRGAVCALQVVRGGLIDGNSATARRWVRSVAFVQLTCIETELAGWGHLFLFGISFGSNGVA